VIVVSDTSPLVNLAAVGQLELLHLLYGKVLLPQVVRQEVEAGVRKMPTNAAVLSAPWLETRSVQNQSLVTRLMIEIDLGEAEAIVLATEAKASFVLMDDQDGRHVAKREGVRTVGLIGVLVEAKKAGCLTAIRPVLDQLRTKVDFWMSDRLYELALRQAGE